MGACLILCEKCITRADGCPFDDSEDVALVPSLDTTSCAGPFLMALRGLESSWLLSGSWNMARSAFLMGYCDTDFRKGYTYTHGNIMSLASCEIIK